MEKIKIICDTDVLIDYFEKDKIRHSQTKEIVDYKIGIDNIALSVISRMELAAGAFNKAELILLNKNIYRFNLLLINSEISYIALKLIEKYNLSHNLSIPDAFVAATSLYTEFELFTYNLKDYRYIEGLKLYSLASV